MASFSMTGKSNQSMKRWGRWKKCLQRSKKYHLNWMDKFLLEYLVGNITDDEEAGFIFFVQIAWERRRWREDVIEGKWWMIWGKQRLNKKYEWSECFEKKMLQKMNLVLFEIILVVIIFVSNISRAISLLMRISIWWGNVMVRSCMFIELKKFTLHFV